MEQNVWISVRGEQYFDGADPDQTELVTEGFLCRTEEGWRLSYEESEMTDMAGTTTTFEFSDEQVILNRSGALNSQMVFSEGMLHSSLYETPYGALTVDVRTEKLAWELSERGGEIEIFYEIAVEHQVTGKNAFRIKVKAK